MALSVIASTAHADPPKPAAHYAKLFELDRVLVYDMVHTYPDHDKAQRLKLEDKPVTRWPRVTERSVIKCKVTRVVKFSAATASQIECDAEPGPEAPRVDGVFLATAQGLYRIGELPAAEADLPKGDDLGPLEIPAAPKVFRVESYVLDDSYKLRDWKLRAR